MLWSEAILDCDVQKVPGAVVIGVPQRIGGVPPVVVRYRTWRAFEDSFNTESGEALEPESHADEPSEMLQDRRISYYRIWDGLWKVIVRYSDPFTVILELSKRETGDWGLVVRHASLLVQQWLPPGEYGNPMPMDPTVWDRLTRGGLEG